MIELKNCIGKCIYGKDSNDSEIWCLYLRSFTKESWGGTLESDQGIFTCGGLLNINISCCCGDEYEGTFTVLKVFDDPQSLLDHIISRFKEEMKVFVYDIDSDNNVNQSMSGTFYPSIETSKCIGKYVAVRHAYMTWLFNIQKVTNVPKYRKYVDTECSAVLDSTSDDDVCIETSPYMIVKELTNATVYDNPLALLKNVSDYIKAEIEKTSGLKW